jgi:cell division septation protein DedD
VGHGSSPYAVQVGATPSQDDAKGLIAHVQKKFSGEVSGFKTDVVAATVDGKTVYRALISGFAGAGDANALCNQLKAGGQACFVRK